MSADVHRITQETLDKLQVEYQHLTTVGRTDIARTIEAARAHGDLSENGDYHAAKDEQGKMESRIRHIDAIIRNHEIVAKDADGSVVTHASIVSVLYEGDAEDEAQEFFIGSIEERPEGVPVATESSPLGAALLGHEVGETVEYEAPSGQLRVKIVGLR